jgi:predicted nucleotidyltransferase
VTSNVEYGDPTVARSNEILRSLVGSGVHGIAIEGTDDRDEMGVFIEPPQFVIGTDQPMDHYTYRTQPEGARSGPGDLDLILYSLRKYLRLAAKGNPTALLPLWAPYDDLVVVTGAGEALRDLRDAFMSQEAVERFLGYMHSQHERMLGRGRRSNVPNRPELIERHGWDVKYGSHALRLAYEGHEIAQRGRLTLPMPDDAREHVLAVKRGEIPQAEVSRCIDELEARVRALLDLARTPLPEKPDWARISRFSQEAHLNHWGVAARGDAISRA